MALSTRSHVFVMSVLIFNKNRASMHRHKMGSFHAVDEEEARRDSRYNLKSVCAETRGILDELDSTYKAPVRIRFLM